jgi:hypothetical protein
VSAEGVVVVPTAREVASYTTLKGVEKITVAVALLIAPTSMG